MKEKIYTIPVNEAFDEDCECPLCFLYKKLENEAVEYALGAAMMEPDYRLLSNDKGYCQKHYSMLFQKPNKLSLALVLDTHLEEIRKKISSLSKNLDNIRTEKKQFFSKNKNTNPLSDFDKTLSDIHDDCVICDKINHTLKRYIEVIFYLWKNDSEFKKKVLNSKGVCIPHLKELTDASFKYLSRDEAAEFSKLLYDKEISELERIQNDIHKFTLKFDYRNKDMEWGTSIDAPIRTIEKIAGHIVTYDKE